MGRERKSGSEERKGKSCFGESPCLNVIWFGVGRTRPFSPAFGPPKISFCGYVKILKHLKPLFRPTSPGLGPRGLISA